MRPRKLAVCQVLSGAWWIFLSAFENNSMLSAYLPSKGGSARRGKAETRAETFDSYTQHPFVLLPMRDEILPNKPSLRSSTVLKMDTPPFLTVVVQSLNRVSCADTEEAQPCRFKFDASGSCWGRKLLKSNHRAIVTNFNRRQYRILDLDAIIHFW
jgi:hypothetical protein